MTHTTRIADTSRRSIVPFQVPPVGMLIVGFLAYTPVGGWANNPCLQQAGVPAGVCQTAEDRCDHHPPLAALNWLTEVTGTKSGRWPVAEVAFTMRESPASIGGRLDRGTPCYGEDRHSVYGALLGMSSHAINARADEGVI